MGRMYTAAFSTAATVAQDLFEVNASATSIVRIHAIHINQSSDTDSEQLRVTIQRATASGSGGSTPTARPLEIGEQAFGGTIEANNTSRATTLTLLHSDAFNVLNGWLYMPTPECRPTIAPSGRIIVGLETAPADSLTLEGTIYLEEIG